MPIVCICEGVDPDSVAEGTIAIRIYVQKTPRDDKKQISLDPMVLGGRIKWGSTFMQLRESLQQTDCFGGATLQHQRWQKKKGLVFDDKITLLDAGIVSGDQLWLVCCGWGLRVHITS
jgi:hypothetical protein